MNTLPDLDALRPWLDRRVSSDEVLSEIPTRLMAASLDLPLESLPPEVLPPLWHWMHFLAQVASAQLGEDGAPRSSMLRPPIDLDQLMWAGAEVECHAPLRLNEPARQVSRILEMTGKSGSRGPMVFLTHEHRIEQGGKLAILERNRTVYLGAATAQPKTVSQAPAQAQRERAWTINEAVLFRFSALTFNTHRIHYDHPYATRVGGYPGLIVHGPLQAILIAETFRQWYPQAVVTRLDFRAMAPLYCGDPLVVRGATQADGRHLLWTSSPACACAMSCVVST